MHVPCLCVHVRAVCVYVLTHECACVCVCVCADLFKCAPVRANSCKCLPERPLTPPQLEPLLLA